jgi:hypothetical protein
MVLEKTKYLVKVDLGSFTQYHWTSPRFSSVVRWLNAKHQSINPLSSDGFFRLAGAVERQRALHTENSGFASPTLGRHISTFCDYRILLKQQWTIEEISIFSNSSHLEWRAGLSDTNLKGTHRTIPTRFGLIWFNGFRGEDLNVIFYQNMPNLHNRYKSAERKFHIKTQNTC